jgi:hypothetical protein
MVRRTMAGLRAALLLALVVLALACVRGGSMPDSLESASIRRAPAVPLLKCESDAFRIDLLSAVDAIPDDTLEAQREQLRDWIWMTTLGRIAPQTSVDDVFSGVMDQPLMRDDSLAHVLRLPVGPTRAATTKKGEVIVLVEAAAQAAMASEVLEAIDDEALSLGHTPEQVQVYGYELRPSVAEASVCKIGRFDRQQLEGAAQSYRSATVTTTADLDQFLSGGVDLLSAQCTASGLQVAGRQRPRNTRATVTVEHVAALAQELGVRYIPPARFGVTFASLPREAREDIEARARRFDELLAEGPLVQQQFNAAMAKFDEEKQRFFRSTLGWKKENPAVPMTEILLSFELQRELDGRPGFSLDPVNTTEAATKSLDELLGALPDRGKLANVLHAWGDDERARSIREASVDAFTFTKVRGWLDVVRARLQRAGDEDVKAILWSPLPDKSSSAGIASELMFSTFGRSGQQCARYDGPLAGTATGMTFFYTDLLAKLWMQGWKGISPEGNVDGFESIVHHVGSTAWCGEEERAFTRLWFGVRDEGYAREHSAGVRFSPTAVRIFAKGSTLGSGDEETEPNAESRRFINWWDRHFARIAEWEPQYEVLNQLMKWSVVAQSARIAGDPSCLRFLQGVAVKSDQRFDRWVTETRDLKWHGPVSLVSAPQKATECLPLFTSEPYRTCGQIGVLSGGVGAASLKQVGAKALRSAETPVGFRRLAAETKPVTVGPNRLQFDKLSRSGGELRGVEIEGSGNRVTFKANIDPTASQRGSLSSSAPGTPVRSTAMSVESNGAELALQQRNNGLPSTGLRVSDLKRADVSVEVKPGVVGEAKVLGRKVADHMAQEGGSLPEAARAFAQKREVQLLDDGRIAVRLSAEDGKKIYAIMDSSGGIRGPPGVEAGLVVGIPQGGAYRPGMGSARPNKPLQVWIASDKVAESYITAQGGKRLLALDEPWGAVREKIGNGDLAGAMQAFERRPTASAAEPLLESAFKRGDTTSAGRVIANLRKSGSPEDLAGLGKIIEKQRVLVERTGGDPSELARLSTRLSIDQRMRLMPRANEGDTIRILGQRLSAYEPATYSSASGLPPAVYPRGKPLALSERHVRRIIEIPSDLEQPATLKTADGTVFKLHAGPGETLNDRRRAASDVGSATRLLFSTQRIVIVAPCSDTDEDLPPCHDSLSEEGRQEFESIKRQLCDHDRNSAFSTPAEHACLAEIGKCDQDGDGLWLTPADVACLEVLSQKSP